MNPFKPIGLHLTNEEQVFFISLSMLANATSLFSSPLQEIKLLSFSSSFGPSLHLLKESKSLRYR
ncbi:hypothetical protein I3843_07G020800 [Carya illinoinensis]|nr:hypothetical protein I3843_07G020800 [Carya illinoinensis]